MTKEKLVRVIFNTGFREEIIRQNFKFPHLERANLDWLIQKAGNTAGVNIDDNIMLKLGVYRDRTRPAYPYFYEAEFYYGTYTNKELFMSSYGINNREICQKFWPQLCKDMDDKFGIRSPIDHQPATPVAIDVFFPCKHIESSAYLYKSDCYKLCTNLGWALFYPDSIKL